MKEFIKWLGLNDKVAKVAVYIAIFMVFMIIFNTFLESVGLPYYMVTYQNLSKIDVNYITDCIISWVITIANFYTIVLLVFRAKEAKPIFKYALLYLILNIVIKGLFGSGINQIFIITYILAFCYLYSGKKKKYIFYSILSFLLNAIVQFISYTYKTKFFAIEDLNYYLKAIINLDCFVLLALIIIVKEVYIKKKRVNDNEIQKK